MGMNLEGPYSTQYIEVHCLGSSQCLLKTLPAFPSPPSTEHFRNCCRGSSHTPLPPAHGLSQHTHPTLQDKPQVLDGDARGRP